MFFRRFPAEPESTEDLPDPLGWHIAADGCGLDHIECSLFRGQQLRKFLCLITDDHFMTRPPKPFRCLKTPRNDLEQCTLAHAVVTDDPQLIPFLQGEVHIFQNDFCAVVTVCDLFQTHDLAAAVRRFRDPDPALKMQVFRDRDVLDLFQHLDPGLHLCRLGGFCPEAVDVVLKFFFALFRIFLQRFRLQTPSFPFFHVVGVVAGIACDPSTVDFQRDIGQRVQQIAVV